MRMYVHTLYELLKAIEERPQKKRHIYHRVRTSYDKLVKYLQELMEKGVVVEEITREGVFYGLTDKGRKLLKLMEEVMRVVGD